MTPYSPRSSSSGKQIEVSLYSFRNRFITDRLKLLAVGQLYLKLEEFVGQNEHLVSDPTTAVRGMDIPRKRWIFVNRWGREM